VVRSSAKRSPISPGYGLTDTQVVFPISSQLALIGAFEVVEDGEMEASEAIVAQINAAIILNANRQIYARDGEFRYRLSHNKKIMRGVDLLSEAWLARR